MNSRQNIIIDNCLVQRYRTKYTWILYMYFQVPYFRSGTTKIYSKIWLMFLCHSFIATSYPTVVCSHQLRNGFRMQNISHSPPAPRSGHVVVQNGNCILVWGGYTEKVSIYCCYYSYIVSSSSNTIIIIYRTMYL